MCEYLTYRFYEEGDQILDYGDCPDMMYIIMDGTVDFVVDLERQQLPGQEIIEIARDLRICSHSLVKNINDRKDRTGISERAKLMEQLR